MKKKKAGSVRSGRRKPKDETDQGRRGDEGKDPISPSPHQKLSEELGAPASPSPLHKGRDALTARTVGDKKLVSGNIEITDASFDSRCITVGNVGDKEESLEGWKIIRKLDEGGRKVEFTFPKVTLKGGSLIKVLFSLSLHDSFTISKTLYSELVLASKQFRKFVISPDLHI